MSPKIRPWMEGKLVVAYKWGVRVYDLGYCLGRCGYDKPEKCPNSEACARYQVYVVRWNQNGTFEWRQAAANATREDAIELASKRAKSEEHFATGDALLLSYIDAANKDGRI